MTQVVDTNLLFMALSGRFSFWKSHDTSVIQKDIDVVVLRIESSGKLFNGG
jgi:hypothetical protein